MDTHGGPQWTTGKLELSRTKSSEGGLWMISIPMQSRQPSSIWGLPPPADVQEPELIPVADGYETMTLAALKEAARVAGLTGYSRLNKSDLIRLLQAQEQV